MLGSLRSSLSFGSVGSEMARAAMVRRADCGWLFSQGFCHDEFLAAIGTYAAHEIPNLAEAMRRQA